MSCKIILARRWVTAFIAVSIMTIAGCGGKDDDRRSPGTRINPLALFTTIGTTAQQTASDALKDWKWNSFIDSFGQLLFQADYSLDMRKVTYTSTGADGTQQTLSGLLILPVSGGSDKPAVPILMYQHATQIYRPQSPSQFLQHQDRPGDYPEVMVAAAIAATGFAVAMPDYEGLGDNTNRHNFVHGASLAAQVIDMLKASRDVIGGTTSTCTWNSDLYLLGYSEGGYATMVATRELQRSDSGFTVTASAPLAGPHDLSGEMRQVILADQQYKAPYFLPFILTSYNRAYASQTSSFSPAFALKPPYATTLPPLLDGTKKSNDISRAMGMSDPLVPIIPKSVLTDQFIALLADDTSPSPVVALLRENDSYRGWVPTVRMRMIHHKDDDLVPFANSQAAFDAFSTAGAKQFVSLQEQTVALTLDPDETVHFSAALPTLIDGWNWLRTQN